MVSRRKSNTPGPGSYFSNDPRPSPPAYTISSKLPEPALSSDWEPGPGSYDFSGKRQGRSFTISGRPPLQIDKNADVPGPGFYNTEHSSNRRHHRQPAYTIGERTLVYQRDVNPGPGAYSLQTTKSSGPAFSIQGRKSGAFADALSENPGPGAYFALIRPRSPAISINGRESKPHVDEIPGPGAYSPDISMAASQGPAYSISRRRPSKAPEETPGPGQYNVDVGEGRIYHRQPAFLIGGKPFRKTVKARRLKAASPGPGAYDPKVACSSSGCSIYERRPLPSMDLTPGPGAYYLDSSVLDVSKGVKIGTKQASPSLEPFPGPGAYSPRSEKDAPAITISTRKHEKNIEDGPGPGEYFWNNKCCVSTSSPAYSMGVRFSEKLVEDGTPGPGAYSLPQSNCGPAFSIHSGTERCDTF